MEIGAYSCKKATPAGSPCCGWCGDMEGCPSSIPRIDKERRDALVKSLAEAITHPTPYTGPWPAYESDPDDPSRIVQVLEDGTRIKGRIVRQFVADQPANVK